MNTKRSFILFLTVILLTAGCAASPYKKISAKQGRDLLNNDSNTVLLDVRTEEEFREIRIPNAILIPLDTLQNNVADTLPDKNTTIVIYCRSGNRSKQAAEILIGMGYKKVYDMGGIIDWPYETEKNP